MFDGVLSQFGPGGDKSPVDAIRDGASKNMSDVDFMATETMKWLQSRRRKMQLQGLAYYDYEHVFKNRDEITKDADGMKVHHEIQRRHIIDNQYANMVDQHVNYILGKPFSLQAENVTYLKLLNTVFDKAFKRMLYNVATDALNGGIAWVHPYYTEQGELAFRQFPGHEIFPFWADDAHTRLDMAVRYYETIAYVDRIETAVRHIEVYSKDRIQRYVLSGGKLIPDQDLPEIAYATVQDANGDPMALSWQRIPLVAFKYNQHEIPLIQRVLGLQNAINETRSNWDRSMNEDIRDTILVLTNYDGEDTADFRKKLMQYGAVKVTDGGSVTTLRIERDSASYTAYLDETKKALIRNARGFDSADDRMSSNPNEMNLLSMYSDIDLDADMIETQFQVAFDQLLWFVDQYLANAGKGDFSKEEVTLSFSRNMIANDTDTITNIKNSDGIVSNETLLAHHPYVSDVQAEIGRLDKEKQDNMNQISGYPRLGKDGSEDGDTK